MEIDKVEKEGRNFKVIGFFMVVISLLFLFYMGISLCRISKKIKYISVTTETSACLHAQGNSVSIITD